MESTAGRAVASAGIFGSLLREILEIRDRDLDPLHGRGVDVDVDLGPRGARPRELNDHQQADAPRGPYRPFKILEIEVDLESHHNSSCSCPEMAVKGLNVRWPSGPIRRKARLAERFSRRVFMIVSVLLDHEDDHGLQLLLVHGNGVGPVALDPGLHLHLIQGHGPPADPLACAFRSTAAATPGPLPGLRLGLELGNRGVQVIDVFRSWPSAGSSRWPC